MSTVNTGIDVIYVDGAGYASVHNSVDSTAAQSSYGHVGGYGYGNATFPDNIPEDVSTLEHAYQISLSEALFKGNQFGAGLINRLLTAEIHSGLTPELYPVYEILSDIMSKDDIAAYSRRFEAFFNLYARDESRIDHSRSLNFGQIQEQVRLESMVGGDCLVIMRHEGGMPSIQVVPGRLVESPISTGENMSGNKNVIIDGVEFNSRGESVAFWVRGRDGESLSPPIRVAAIGSTSGRLMSFLVKGAVGVAGQVRGTPLLTRIMVSLDQLQEARRATTTSFKLNSMIALFMKKDQQLPGTKPISNSAVRRGENLAGDSVTASLSGNSSSRQQDFNTAGLTSGTVFETLQAGETPVPYTNEVGSTLGEFEKTLISAMSWVLECPPEIMRQEFNKSFAASQAAILEFRLYLSKRWSIFGANFCSKIMTEVMIGFVLTGKVESAELLESYLAGPSGRDTFRALTNIEWLGTIKVSADPSKHIKASVMLLEKGWTTNSRESRLLNGSRFEDNVARIAEERKILAEAGLSDDILSPPA